MSAKKDLKKLTDRQISVLREEAWDEIMSCRGEEKRREEEKANPPKLFGSYLTAQEYFDLERSIGDDSRCPLLVTNKKDGLENIFQAIQRKKEKIKAIQEDRKFLEDTYDKIAAFVYNEDQNKVATVVWKEKEKKNKKEV